jgi:hypothetical protein
MNRKLFVSLAALGLAVSPVGAIADDAAQKPVTVHSSSKKGMVSGGRVEQASATITAIDTANRTISLKGKSGEVDTIKVGPEVKNFAQLKVGDVVTVTFSQGLVLSLQAPDAKPVEPSVTVQGEAAKAGAKPGGDAKATLKGTVTVTAIDMATRIVSLTGPEGRVFKVKAGKEIALEKLKVGDKVLAEYSETVAVAVTPAKAKKPAKK